MKKQKTPSKERKLTKPIKNKTYNSSKYLSVNLIEKNKAEEIKANTLKND